MNMKKIGLVYLIIMTGLLGAWFLPRLYRLLTVKANKAPFTLYSCTLDKFTWIKESDGKGIVFEDAEGNEYDDSVQPMFYHRDVIASGMMPDSIKGRAVTLEEIERNYFIFMSDPDDLTKNLPKVYLLMESSPERVDLSEPEYAFVFRKSGVDIIRMQGNELDEEKTAAFTKALSDVGFHFPAGIVNGVPSDRKDYDEGYVLTDSDGNLFHMKMVKEKPFAEAISKPDSLEIKHAFITEYPSHKTLAFITDQDSRWYVVDSTRRIIPTDVIADPESKDMMMVGDMFYITVKANDKKLQEFWALDSNTYATVDTMTRK